MPKEYRRAVPQKQLLRSASEEQRRDGLEGAVEKCVTCPRLPVGCCVAVLPEAHR